MSGSVVVDRVAADALHLSRSSNDRPLPTLPINQPQKHSHNHRHLNQHNAMHLDSPVPETSSSASGPPKGRSLISGFGKRARNLASTPLFPSAPATYTSTQQTHHTQYTRDNESVSRSNYMPATATLTTVGIDELGIIFAEILMGMAYLSNHIPELATVVKYIQEIKDNLVMKRDEIKRYITALPPQTVSTYAIGVSSPYSPTMKELASSPQSSPMAPIPFSRGSHGKNVAFSESSPTSTAHIIYNWLYEIQKVAWVLNEKIKKYQRTPLIGLSTGYHRRKIIDFCTRIRASWVELILELGIALAQSNSINTCQVAQNITKLAIATGMPDDWADIGLDDAKTIFMQGEKYFMGYGVVKSFDIAFKRYETAARMDLAEASNMLGVMLEFGLGRERDITSATKWYRRAAEGKSAEALNNLGRLYELGKGCQISHVLALEMYKRASKLGHLDGMTNYGFMLENGLGGNQDLHFAMEMYKSAADSGYARAQNALGGCYYCGRGTRRDYTDAVMWYRRAADQGFPPAHNNLGICYEEGHGAAKDHVMAKMHYQKAAELRHPSGTNNLGYMLLVEGDFILAMQYFNIALLMGSVDAAYHLGTIYESGCSEPTSLVRRVTQLSQPPITRQIDLAIRYYQIAADQRHTRAQVRLATLLIFIGQSEDSTDNEISLLGRQGVVNGTQPSLDVKFGGSLTRTSRNDVALKYLLMAATPTTPTSSGNSVSNPHATEQSASTSSLSYSHQQGNRSHYPEWQHYDNHRYSMYSQSQGQNSHEGSLIPLDLGVFKGDPDAQNMLGEMIEMGYAGGIDGDGDPAVAASWYRRAVYLGHVRATFNLAALYEAGQGVEKDYEKSTKLYREAARRGSKDAADRLATLSDLPISPM
ncbi:hypothetical protein BASA81_016308 [Batrachochytrium salamandrivorans]|nr:hypothetical protein BASA81_016308 [Batrachochytrium salamandrivorans]